MKRYYELTAAVREKLAAAGEDDAADELLWVERCASTSGEVISNVGVVVGGLHESGALTRVDVRDQADELAELGRPAWEASNRGDVAR